MNGIQPYQDNTKVPEGLKVDSRGPDPRHKVPYSINGWGDLLSIYRIHYSQMCSTSPSHPIYISSTLYISTYIE